MVGHSVYSVCSCPLRACPVGCLSPISVFSCCNIVRTQSSGRTACPRYASSISRSTSYLLHTSCRFHYLCGSSVYGLFAVLYTPWPPQRCSWPVPLLCFLRRCAIRSCSLGVYKMLYPTDHSSLSSSALPLPRLATRDTQGSCIRRTYGSPPEGDGPHLPVLQAALPKLASAASTKPRE